MRTLRTIEEFGSLPAGCVLTIGNFDGVHVGHKEILSAASRIAGERKAAIAVMTFEPHPVAVLHPEKAPGVLTPLKLKSRLLSHLAVDYLIVLKDTPSLLGLSAEEFVDKFLVRGIRPTAVVEGDDFNFGAGRSGGIETLQQMGREHGFDVAVSPPKYTQLAMGQMVRVSSTMIRYMIEAGHAADAASVLGRPYRLIGEIVPGRGKGKELGFPTLNMKQPEQVIPAQGVYAGYVDVGDMDEAVLEPSGRHEAVFSVGQARTFGDELGLLIEAHLLGSGGVSGRWMAMDFVEHIRPQHKFAEPQDLAAQIARDCRRAGEILSGEQGASAEDTEVQR